MSEAYSEQAMVKALDEAIAGTDQAPMPVWLLAVLERDEVAMVSSAAGQALRHDRDGTQLAFRCPVCGSDCGHSMEASNDINDMETSSEHS